MDQNDKRLGMNRRITRRDFIDGVARSIALTWSVPLWSSDLQLEDDSYPPAYAGLRGSNEGSYEVAHQLRDGSFHKNFTDPSETGEVYDLVVVGGGISGLTAALFFQKAAGSGARILILDNHDDFGGHARRQEFRSGNAWLLGHGGSFAIESPAPYSRIAAHLIEDLGIDVPSFKTHLKTHAYSSLGLEVKFFADKKTFGTEILLPDPFESSFEPAPADAMPRFVEKIPWSESAKKQFITLHKNPADYYPGLDSAEKKSRLARISYADFLTQVVKCDPALLPYFQARPHSLYGAGIDIVPAQDAWGLGYPGFEGLNLSPEPGRGMNRDSIPDDEAEKYFFHFPDGNATIARLLLRRLIPQAIPGTGAGDIVAARARYDKLDLDSSPVRLRLNSTVTRVTNKSGGVEVSYVQKGKYSRVRGAKCVLACWHSVIPYICPELPSPQKTALAYAIKVPLLFVRVALRNWKPWLKLGAHSIHAPGNYFSHIQLPMPLRFSGYSTADTPEEPVLISMFRAPCKPGFPVRLQHRLGRAELLTMSWKDYERNIRQELEMILGPAGFDPANDITGIAVHRWPHGYAYQYNSLADPFWRDGKRPPCEMARKPFGRIFIANSDADAYAYVDSAIDQAHRAIQELLDIS